MSEASKGKYLKSEIMKMFGLNDPQMNRVIATYKDLPTGENLFDSRKIYNDETIKYMEGKGIKKVTK